jgi:hypothetical protein
MTWAKIVDEEVVQIFDGDVRQHWHVDALALWEDVPNDIGIAEGWHRKEDESWVSAEVWQAEVAAAEEVVAPGPPCVAIDIDITNLDDKLVCVCTYVAAGVWDEDDATHIGTWTYNETETSTDNPLTIEFPRNQATFRDEIIKCVFVGTAGASEEVETDVRVAPPA